MTQPRAWAAKSSGAPAAAAEADDREVRGKQAAVCQVVDGRHELLAGQVPGDAEEDQRGGPGNAVQPPVPSVAQGIGMLAGGAG